jgi:hypothetical protein
MEKTEQQKRFEAEFRRESGYTKNSCDRELTTDATGNYAVASVAKSAFMFFQLGEASALERAAAKCDQVGCDWRDTCDYRKFYAANYLVEAIRALAQEVGK